MRHGRKRGRQARAASETASENIYRLLMDIGVLGCPYSQNQHKIPGFKPQILMLTGSSNPWIKYRVWRPNQLRNHGNPCKIPGFETQMLVFKIKITEDLLHFSLRFGMVLLPTRHQILGFIAISQCFQALQITESWGLLRFSQCYQWLVEMKKTQNLCIFTMFSNIF